MILQVSIKEILEEILTLQLLSNPQGQTHI